MEKKDLLRGLPKIDELLKEEVVKNEFENSIRSLVVDCLRESIEIYRQNILDDKINSFSKDEVLGLFINLLEKSKTPHLKKVINATGVIIHTNLGRSILCDEAVKNVINVAKNYSNLEYDIESGERGSRYSHVEELIIRITGAEAALVVNNNAAAVLLAMDTLCKGREAVVSRGQLVEIGGSFRVPEVMKYSGAALVEVGTTNRTHLYDYENAVNENTGVILKVHTSNFKIFGFTEEVPLTELVELGRRLNVPVMEDIGSGTLIDFSHYGISYEPTVQKSIKSGVDVVTFSGDKMLGGPQAGIIAGKKAYIDRMKKNQLTRALRIDKMTLAALEGTLKYYLDDKSAVDNIPTLNALLSPKEVQKKKAVKLKKKLHVKVSGFKFEASEDYSIVGGGSMPSERIPTFVIKASSEDVSASELEKRLRNSKVPVIVRVSNDEIIMDLRTILEEDFDIIVDAFLSMDTNQFVEMD
jgi:L-seryl-tRNA(Ser) seleniumtransferase